MSNLKQIGLGIMMYTQDYDERLPSCYLTDSVNKFAYPVGDPNQTGTWRLAIYPYVKSVQVFNCPSADSDLEWKGRYSITKGSYAYNYATPVGTGLANLGENMGPMNSPGAKLAAIEDVAGTILVAEGSSTITRIWNTDFPTEASLKNTGTCSDTYDRSKCLRAPHMDTMNTLFVDGHVKSMKWQTILGSPTDVNSMRYWTTSSD